MHNNTKKFLAIIMLIFSLLNFVNPVTASTFFEISSDKILDFDAEPEQENDAENDTEKTTLFFLQKFSFFHICAYSPRPVLTLHTHSYYNNSSLFKPPIFS